MARDIDDGRLEKALRRVGYSAAHVERAAVGVVAEEPVLYEVRFKLDADQGTSVLAILKAQGEAGPLVGFVGAPDFSTCLIALGAKLAAGAVKWRVDKPWEGGS